MVKITEYAVEDLAVQCLASILQYFSTKQENV